MTMSTDLFCPHCDNILVTHADLKAGMHDHCLDELNALMQHTARQRRVTARIQNSRVEITDTDTETARRNEHRIAQRNLKVIATRPTNLKQLFEQL